LSRPTAGRGTVLLNWYDKGVSHGHYEGYKEERYGAHRGVVGGDCVKGDLFRCFAKKKKSAVSSSVLGSRDKKMRWPQPPSQLFPRQ
jgi:hypothetical protein